MSEDAEKLAPSGLPDLDLSHLVTEDDQPVDNIYSEKQFRLLTEPLYASWGGPPPDEDGAPRPFLALANVGFYLTIQGTPLVPDVMLSADVSAPEEMHEKRHKSYLLWEYGKVPDVVIEVVSNKEGGELDTRRRAYARGRIPHYVVWDPAGYLGAEELYFYALRGHVYERAPESFFEELGLGLQVWEGEYEGARERWPRWCDQDGKLLPTGKERAESEKARAESEKARAESEKARAESEKARAERLAARLRALGEDPDAG